MSSYTTIIRTNDGTRISLNTYSPAFSNGKLIIIAPGIGLIQDFYEPFAGYLCEHGFTVITFDYRGVGSSAPENLKGFKANMHQWAVQDTNAVLINVKQQYSTQEIIYFGHCIGGEIIGLAPASQYIHRMVLISSALSCARLFPINNRIKIAGLKTLARISSWIYGYFPGKRFYIFDDLPKGVVHEWANWCDKSNGLFDLFPDNNYRKLNVPILAFTFSDDWHTPPDAVKELLNKFENATITWYHLKPRDIGLKKIGHNDFFHLTMKTTLWKTVLAWVNGDERIQKENNTMNIKHYLNE